LVAGPGFEPGLQRIKSLPPNRRRKPVKTLAELFSEEAEAGAEPEVETESPEAVTEPDAETD